MAGEEHLRSDMDRGLELIGPAVTEANYPCWGASPILGEDGTAHLFVARWPEGSVGPGWRKSSGIAHYVADKPDVRYAASGNHVSGGPRAAVYGLRINLASGDGPLPGRKRVACLGDSITFGAGAEPREKFSYPAQLGAMLGNDYEVRNFGVGSSTVLMAGDKPYRKQPQFQAALDFDPDIVVVMLGVNDTCAAPRGNWEKSAAFVNDAREMLQALQRPGRRVIVALPTPMLPMLPGLKPARQADLEARCPRLEQVRDWWREAARTEHAEVVDLSKSLEPDSRFVTDGVHPTAAGYTKIAQSVKEQITKDASSRREPSARTSASLNALQ
jgi:lysophospholipase L1-like esterase